MLHKAITAKVRYNKRGGGVALTEPFVYRTTTINQKGNKTMNDSILERLEILEKAVAVLAEQLKSLNAEAGMNFLMIDDILEAHSDCLDILVEESPDLEMIYPEDDDVESATILTLVVDNTKDEE